MRGASSRRKLKPAGRRGVTRNGTPMRSSTSPTAAPAPAPTTATATTTWGSYGVLSQRRQDVHITNQEAYNNATAWESGGSTSDGYHEPGPAIETTKTQVKEVNIGPGITLREISLNDYNFITGLPVVEEQQH